MSIIIHRYLHPVWILFCLSPLVACATATVEEVQYFEGQVVERETNKPIPGVMMVGKWEGSVSMIADSRTVCRHVEIATTDERGIYHMALWKGKRPNLTYSYKPGYMRSDLYYRTRAYVDHGDILERFSGSTDDRLSYLARAAVGCEQDEMKLLSLYKALYEEANSIAVTREQKIKALHHLTDIEKLEVGSTRAWENFDRRKKALK